MLAQCLAGTRVLDLSCFVPGPFATQWLADLGAEVVKVEPPAGDPLRTMGPLDPDGTTPFYKLANRNKTVVRLDLKQPDGRRTFERLAAAADVLVAGLRPGALERLGLGAQRLRAINPRLIHCALSGYGQTGPLAGRAGHDLTYMALSGGLTASGPAERPVMTFPPLADHAGAQAVVTAVLAALLARGRTGQGLHLDVSLTEAAQAWMGGVLTIAERWGNPPREQGLINGGAACYRLYRTRDGGWMALAALEGKFWAAFCTVVGHPEWIHRHNDPLPQAALIAELEALFAARTRAEWVAALAAADCCCEPVLDPVELPDHPQARARGLVRRSDGLVEVLLPVLMDGACARDRRPHVDEEVETVLTTWR